MSLDLPAVKTWGRMLSPRKQTYDTGSTSIVKDVWIFRDWEFFSKCWQEGAGNIKCGTTRHSIIGIGVAIVEAVGRHFEREASES